MLSLTHDVEDIVSDLGGSDCALFGVSLQYLQHGLQLAQRAVLTLLTDELTALGLENTRTDTLKTHSRQQVICHLFYTFMPVSRSSSAHRALC